MLHQAKIMPEKGKKYRLVTRSDMDGLVCAVLLKRLGFVDVVDFAHPKDMQDGLVKIGEDDITTNLPYVPGVYLAIDHHDSEAERVEGNPDNHVIDIGALSAARVVYDYFGGADVFPAEFTPMMDAVDKADAAQFNQQDILDSQGWELLSFLMDSRTGLGRFRDFRISNFQLMMQLIDYCLESCNIENILALPDVAERVELYKEHEPKFIDQVKRCSKVYKNLVVLDIRDQETIYAGNRFMIYALFPQCNISIHAMWGKAKQNTVFATGKSILNRTSKTHVGKLMLEYGGGGHKAAGTCQVANDAAETALQDLIRKINADG
ncbi:MAG: exopolyphosphatase [Pseudomonadota bacterium]